MGRWARDGRRSWRRNVRRRSDEQRDVEDLDDVVVVVVIDDFVNY